MNNESIRISHPKKIAVQKAESKGKFHLDKGQILSFVERAENSGISVLICNFENEVNFNQIILHPSADGKEFFPDSFRFEISMDGKVWEPIIQEVGFRGSKKEKGKWNFSLVQARYLKLISKMEPTNGKNEIHFGKLEISVSGVVSLSVSSEKDRLWVKENLVDERPDYGWASAISNSPKEEFFQLDLGSISRVNELRLLSKNAEVTSFPENFKIYFSEDDLTWHQLLEENQFLSEKGTWYQWRFLPVNMRFLRFVGIAGLDTETREYSLQIAEVELYASPYLSDLTQKPTAEALPYATVLRAGLVRLGLDGETSEGVAVQTSDRRLRDSTTEYKGIVELATDGEDRPGVVVQGNDKRLKIATESTHGLVRLAQNGETKEGKAVQGNDERLREATTSHPGIVELAENGETRDGVAVQGNDDRLKKASRNKYGLVILAQSGEADPNKVITSDDERLRSATTEQPGIMRFAQNGEESKAAAVQGDDKRLRKGTEEYPGIVRLARSGQAESGLVVQGDDERLKKADTKSPGIVTLAEVGKNTSGSVVTADDPRLYDARKPLPHEHDYASKEHDFASHTGLIRLKGDSAAPYKAGSPPPEKHAVIYAQNSNLDGSGMAGVGVNSGVIGYGENYGMIAYSNSADQQAAGILGLAKTGPGGRFLSRRDYAIIAEGLQNSSLDEKGSGKAFLAEGQSDFRGELRIHANLGQETVSVRFVVRSEDVLQPGDLLCVTDEDGVLTKSRERYATGFIGVFVKESPLQIYSAEKKDQKLVAIAGIVHANVDADAGAIRPGDLLVTGISSGYAEKADPSKLKPGMLIGKALSGWRSGKGQIPILLGGV